MSWQGLQTRLYKPRVPLMWWLTRRTYAAFILRELSSVFVGWFVVYLLLMVRAVSHGPAAFETFLDRSGNPFVVALNGLTLGFVVYHTITFANLTPQAMVLKIRGRRVPSWLLLGQVYGGWLVVSAVLAWLVVG